MEVTPLWGKGSARAKVGLRTGARFSIRWIGLSEEGIGLFGCQGSRLIPGGWNRT